MRIDAENKEARRYINYILNNEKNEQLGIIRDSKNLVFDVKQQIKSKAVIEFLNKKN